MQGVRIGAIAERRQGAARRAVEIAYGEDGHAVEAGSARRR